MKAIKIDGVNQTITRVDLGVEHLKDAQRHVGGYIDSVGFSLGDNLLVDEEGIAKRLPFGFNIKSVHGATLIAPCVIYGSALIVGFDAARGRWKDCVNTVESVESTIDFWAGI